MLVSSYCRIMLYFFSIFALDLQCSLHRHQLHFDLEILEFLTFKFHHILKLFLIFVQLPISVLFCFFIFSGYLFFIFFVFCFRFLFICFDMDLNVKEWPFLPGHKKQTGYFWKRLDFFNYLWKYFYYALVQWTLLFLYINAFIVKN